MSVFSANGITKSFRGKKALDNVSVTLQRGRIYGFVGLNGAGKSTFMRIMAGLIFPDEGSIELLGETSRKGLERARRRVGFLIETPAFYGTMSGYASLNAVRMYKGSADKSELCRLLDRVGIDPSDRGKLVKNYSLGMRQRLGLAAAMLGDPELLVLDEPINGLDPAGVREFRSMLKGLADEGRTLLVSSHILSELFELATDYIFIHEGKIVEQISTNELALQGGKSLEEYFFELTGGERDA